MKLAIISLALSFALTGAFTSQQPRYHATTIALKVVTDDSGTSSAETEAQRLLRKAREMRAKAEEAEQQIHTELAQRKDASNDRMDKVIDCLFFTGEDNQLVDRLREKRLSAETLEKIVDRLDEREVVAEGKEHVQAKLSGEDTSFERVATADPEELQRIQGCIDKLIDAVKVLDSEFVAEKKKKGESHVNHTEDQHWGGGKQAQRLLNRSHEIRRERDEQFQKRMQEFNDAQRIKDTKQNAPKVKDDHGFLP